MPADKPPQPNECLRRRQRLTVRGLVQGVGFRPFVYALARQYGLSGAVGNTGTGVWIEVEGDSAALAEFASQLVSRPPPLARIDEVSCNPIDCRGGTEFVIRPSDDTPGRTLVSPDIATCTDCLAELADPANRRYRHPFISCTNCGPRLTVIRELPYDRPRTTMAELPLCADCAREYADPADRRFHAQTIACPACGPVLRLAQATEPDLFGEEALRQARRLLRAGAIVAVKGLGGYHLACDATDEAAVHTLRKRKDRGDKPFAVLVADADTAAAIAAVSPAERALLTDARRPVLLLARRPDPELPLAESVAPGRPDLGVLLPYTPVHHLLLGLPGDEPGPRVLVLTSGNLAGEPIVTDDEQARVRLAGLVDAWLTNDRPIQLPCDDSVVRLVAGAELPVRRSRGYAPLPVALPVPVRPVLAVGGDLKNTFCLADSGYAWLSGHIGDMDDLATLQAFEVATGQLRSITGVRPELLVADRHPGYRSAAWARAQQGVPVRLVQHHHAHIASALADNGHPADRPVIGFAFDGTGYGDDGAVWGGEVLVADYAGYRRVGHLRYAWLPGGDAGVRNPCRMALSQLRSAGLAWDPALPSVAACSPTERTVLARQLASGLSCARTSSMGRLFDAVSSLVGVCHRVAYEAEAAMLFEELAAGAVDGCQPRYRFDTSTAELDPRPVIAGVARDVLAGTPAAVIAAAFHLAVADLVVQQAQTVRARTGLDTVALSGGVFLNALLTQLCLDRLPAAGFRVLRHRLVPPSDAGLALGQVMIAARLQACG